MLSPFSENAKVFVIACLGLLVAAGGAFAARGPVAYPGADEHVHVHTHEGSPRIHAHTHPGRDCDAAAPAMAATAEREAGGNQAIGLIEIDPRIHQGCSHDHDCHHAPFFAASLAEMRLDEYIPSFSAPLPALWQPQAIRDLPAAPSPPAASDRWTGAIHQLRTVVLLT